MTSCEQINLELSETIRALETANNDLVTKLLIQDDEIKELKKELDDEIRKSGILKMENSRYKEIIREMAKEKLICRMPLHEAMHR